MILREVSDTGIVVSSFRYFCKWYGLIEQRMINIYHNSQTYRLISEFWKKIKICFRYSFLGKITEAGQISPVVLDNSRTVQYLLNFYKRRKERLSSYLGTSLAIMLAKDTEKELYSLSIRIISIVVVTAIAVNVFLSIVLHRQIGLWGWLMRGLFLLVAVSGLFCKAEWPNIKENSIFLKKLQIGRNV